LKFIQIKAVTTYLDVGTRDDLKEFVQLELEKQRLEIEQKKLELQKQQLDLHTQRIDHALETADRLVNMLPPEVDTATKVTLLQILLPGLLPLGEKLNYVSALGILKISTEYVAGVTSSNK